MGDAEQREAAQTFVGLYEILTNELDLRHKQDFEHFVQAEENLVKIRIARLEERMNGLRVLVGALGAALAAMGGVIAILAD